ncbi:MAG TPA: lytic transglycosylase domain-containing protein, partial [Myxococcota bacterium]|nr:lytic transglycosylase domain-containing protein [Myxococcota bacterium]
PYGVAATGTAIGVSSLANKVEGLIRDQVLRGMADPETLKMLANTATDAQMKIAYERLLPAVITSMRSQMDSPSPSEGQISPPEELSLETSSPKSITPTPTSKAKQFTSTDPVDIAIEEAIRMKEGTPPLPQADDFTKLLKAVSLQESSGNPNVVHPMTSRGERAQGLHGVLPSTAKDIAKELGITKYDLKDPETNTRFAAHYLKQMIDMFGGDTELGLAAYHSGPGRIKTLLKLYNGKTLADIRPYLGQHGKVYASGVLSKLKKIDKYGTVKT